jgi:hypothetical protein
METRRWTNPHQPQTLQVAVILLYVSAALEILFPGSIYTSFGSRFGQADLFTLLAIVGMGAGAFGIANERKWGYTLAVAVTGIGVLELVLLLMDEGIERILSVGFILVAIFPVARFALLVHPMSREHQRIWFR